MRLLAVFFFACLALAAAEFRFEAHRLVQYDRVYPDDPTAMVYGSRRTGFSLPMTTPDLTDDLSRKLSVINLADVSEEYLGELVDVRKASGILIVLPTDLSGVVELWRNAGELLAQMRLDIPIYFAFDDDTLGSVLNNLSPGEYQVDVSEKEASRLRGIAGAYVYGNLHGTDADVSDSQSTIAVIAHYDTLSIAPSLAGQDPDTDVSGAVAVLELARLFSSLYSSSMTRGRASLVFVLTPGAALNFAGVRAFVTKSDSTVVEDLQFALCLDSLLPMVGSPDELYLHVSRPPKTAEAESIHSALETVASEMGSTLTVVQKKVNVSNTDLPWPHEELALHRVPAVTLSTRRVPFNPFAVSRPWEEMVDANDQRIRPSRPLTSEAAEELLMRNIGIVAESLARHIFSPNAAAGSRVFEGPVGPSALHVRSWAKTLTEEPWVSPFAGGKGDLLSGLERTIASLTTEAALVRFPLDAEFTFYSSSSIPESPKPVELVVYGMGSITNDVALAGAVVLYLFIMYCVLAVYSQGKDALLRDLGFASHVPLSSPRTKRD